jgi:hypothetical protein
MAGKEDDKNKQNTTANILVREIESWKSFEYALREENRILFNKMLSECRENQNYIRAKGSFLNHELSLLQFYLLELFLP